MIHLAGDFPAWAVLLVVPVGIISGLSTLAGLAIAGGVGAGLAGIARHIQGFVEGNPWWEDPLDNLRQDAINFGTGVATAGATQGLGSALGSAFGSIAAEAGAQAGPSAAAGQVVPRALTEVAKQGAQNAATSGALGAARAAVQGDDPLRAAAMGAAGGLVQGAGQGVVGQALPGAYQPMQGPPRPFEGIGSEMGRIASTMPARLATGVPGVLGTGARMGVGMAMTPGPPPLPEQSPFPSGYPYSNPLFRYDRF